MQAWWWALRALTKELLVHREPAFPRRHTSNRGNQSSVESHEGGLPRVLWEPRVRMLRPGWGRGRGKDGEAPAGQNVGGA